MKSKAGSMLIEMLVILVIGSAGGLGYNHVRRDHKHVDLNKAFFEKRTAPPNMTNPPPVQPDEHLQTTPAGVGKHGWQAITREELAALLKDPITQGGGNMIVDARKPEFYDGGHVPGAVRVFPDYAAEELPGYLEQLMAAQKVVVYCGGGDCEDSSFMCRELIDRGLPFGKLYLYEGGWHDWSDNKMPVEPEGRP